MSADHIQLHVLFFLYIVPLSYCYSSQVGYMAAAMGSPAEIPTAVVSFHDR